MGGDEGDDARALGKSRLDWVPRQRFRDGGAGVDLGQLKGESQHVAMAVWCPPLFGRQQIAGALNSVGSMWKCHFVGH